MTILDLLTEDNFTPVKKGPREYASPCPGCGGGDRFITFVEDNRFWCRQCGKKGDVIAYLMTFRNMHFRQAAEHVGREVENRHHLPKPSKQPPVPAKPQTPTMEEIKQPQPDSWATAASAFVQYAHEQLKASKEAQEWLLEERGIRMDTAERFRLGWVAKNMFRQKRVWGLPEDGKKLFIPAGLVIPWHSRRVRIRRSDPGKYGRYYNLSGSETDPTLIGNPHETTAIIVESELDAILLAQEVTRPLFIVALGSTSVSPHDALLETLTACPVVLVALDNDKAGGKAARTWLVAIEGSVKTLPPRVKDIGEAFCKGMNLNDWVSISVELVCDEITHSTATDLNDNENKLPSDAPGDANAEYF